MSTFKTISIKIFHTIPFVCVVLIALTKTIAAEPVRINNGTAHGYMFEFSGNCYVAAPSHAVRLGGRAAIATSEPVVNGGGVADLPFWDGLDLAVIVVNRGLTERCRGQGANILSASFDPVANQRGNMILIRSSGQVLRRPMRISKTNYLTFEADFLDVADPNADEIFQGMSGTFLFVNGTPVGMAIEKAGPTTLRFMRIEEVSLNLGRWLGTQGAVFIAPPSDLDPVDGSLPLVLIDAQTPAVDTDSFPENFLTEAGAYIFEPSGPASIILQIDNDAAQSVRQVIMQTASVEGQSVPQGVRIEVDSSRGDRPRWRHFWGGQMRRDGVLDTGPRSATFARRIRITITSAWGPGPVRIDQIKVR